MRSPTFTKRYVAAPDGGQIHVSECGQGRPLLLLHQTPRNWDEHASVMSRLEGYRCIAIDIPGHGQTTSELESIERAALAALAVLDALHLVSVDVVGHHFGGLVAYELAALAPHRVRTLTLSSTPYLDAAERERRQGAGAFNAVGPREDGEHLAELWRRRCEYLAGRPIDTLSRYVRDVLDDPDPDRGHGAVDVYRSEERLGRYRGPTLLVSSALDPRAFPRRAGIAAAFPQARQVTLPRGDISSPETNAAEFAAAVMAFHDGLRRDHVTTVRDRHEELPATMLAVRLTGQDEERRFELVDVEVPTPGDGQVVVEVDSTAVNNADLLQLRGVLPAPAPGGIPGLECLGTVVSVGPGVELPIGQRVTALLRSGGYARFAIARADCCIPIPVDTEVAEANLLLEAPATAWFHLVLRARLRAGERVLVAGGAGGVGAVAIQVARHLGAEVMATARGATKAELCRRLGADEVIDYSTTDVAAEVRARYPEGIDVVLDNQGGPALESNLSMLAPGGRLVVMGTQAGASGTVDVASMMVQGIEVSSASLGRLGDAERADLCAAVGTQLVPLLASGRIDALLGEAVPLHDFARAHQEFWDPDRVGKVLINCVTH